MLDTLVAAVTPELAEAVAIALALDPRDRYQTAREMGRGLRDGSPRHRPPGAGEAHPQRRRATQATSVLSAGRRGRPRRGGTVGPRRPRQGTARAVPAAQAAPRRRAAREAEGRPPPRRHGARGPRARARGRGGRRAPPPPPRPRSCSATSSTKMSAGIGSARTARLRKHQVETAIASPGHPQPPPAAARGWTAGHVRHARAPGTCSRRSNVSQLVETAGYPASVPARDERVRRRARARRDGADHGGRCSASQGKLEIEIVIALAAAGRDRWRQHRLPDRPQGRALAARASRAPSTASACRCSGWASPSSSGTAPRQCSSAGFCSGCACGPRGWLAPHACAGAVRCWNALGGILWASGIGPDRILPRALRRQRDRSVRHLRPGGTAAGGRQCAVRAPSPSPPFRARAGSATRANGRGRPPSGSA